MTGGGAPAEIWCALAVQALPHIRQEAIPGAAPAAPADSIGDILAPNSAGAAPAPRQDGPEDGQDSSPTL